MEPRNALADARDLTGGHLTARQPARERVALGVAAHPHRVLHRPGVLDIAFCPPCKKGGQKGRKKYFAEVASDSHTCFSLGAGANVVDPTWQL